MQHKHNTNNNITNTYNFEFLVPDVFLIEKRPIGQRAAVYINVDYSVLNSGIFFIDKISMSLITIYEFNNDHVLRSKLHRQLLEAARDHYNSSMEELETEEKVMWGTNWWEAEQEFLQK